MLIVVDDSVRPHLRLAIEMYLRSAAREHIAVPGDLRRLGEALDRTGAARTGHVGTSAASAVEPGEDQAMTSPMVLDFAAVSVRLGVSVRTVRRLVERGHLATVIVGTRRRVRLVDLDDYLQRENAA